MDRRSLRVPKCLNNRWLRSVNGGDAPEKGRLIHGLTTAGWCRQGMTNLTHSGDLSATAASYLLRFRVFRDSCSIGDSIPRPNRDNLLGLRRAFRCGLRLTLHCAEAGVPACRRSSELRDASAQPSPDFPESVKDRGAASAGSGSLSPSRPADRLGAFAGAGSARAYSAQTSARYRPDFRKHLWALARCCPRARGVLLPVS